MPPPFFIVGPTAMGKTGIAVAVAERCGAEIVSADAFQVYCGLDLLTAKPSAEERRRVPHHLIGTVPLAEAYSVARFAEEARQCIDAVSQRDRPVIVVGGSGMYVKALTHGLSPLPPAQPTLRAELEELGLDELQLRLRLLDPETADVIDGRNKRRLIRAVEVCVVTGRRFSDFREQWFSPAKPPTATGVFLVRNKDELNARIKRRVEGMFNRGVIEEVAAVNMRLISDTASRMIGWREVQDHLNGKFPLERCMERIDAATRRYAKRQMTWFRGERIFEEIVLSEGDDSTLAVEQICGRLTQDRAGL